MRPADLYLDAAELSELKLLFKIFQQFELLNHATKLYSKRINALAMSNVPTTSN